MSPITTLNDGITGASFRGQVNTNFSNLNTDKAETSALTSGLATKQDTLVSGTNIKTVNGNSLLGSGDITISGGGSVATDTIWDAKGDLAGGTGANTASRLPVGYNGQVLTADSAEATGMKWSNPAGGGDALTSGTLAQFASTTSSQLDGVISDNTGSGGLLVFSNSPAITTPSIAAINVSGGVLTLPTGASDTLVGKITTDTFSTGVKTFLDGILGLRNVANTFTSFFKNTNTASRTYTLKDANGTIAFTSDITGTNSGTNTGDETTGRINALYGTSNAFTAGSIELGHASDTTISRDSAGIIAVEGKKVTTYATTTEASNATPTPAVSATNHTHTVTALAVGATFGAPTGTPFDGQNLIIRVKDNGTARTLAFNAIYRASSDLALPTTTVISKTLYMGFKYNSADSKWDLLALLNNI